MKISEELETIVQYAREEAMRTGCYTIRPEHLMLGILRHGQSSAMQELAAAGIDSAQAKKAMESCLFHEHSIPWNDLDSVRLSAASDAVLNLATAKAIAAGRNETLATDLLHALAAGTGFCAKYLSGIAPEDYRKSRNASPCIPDERQIEALLSALKTDNNICS